MLCCYVFSERGRDFPFAFRQWRSSAARKQFGIYSLSKQQVTHINRLTFICDDCDDDDGDDDDDNVDDDNGDDDDDDDDYDNVHSSHLPLILMLRRFRKWHR